MKQELSIESLLTERAIRENIVTGVNITDSTITVKLKPNVKKVDDRPDCGKPVSVEQHDREVLTVQGLGIQGGRCVIRLKASDWVTSMMPVNL